MEKCSICMLLFLLFLCVDYKFIFTFQTYIHMQTYIILGLSFAMLFVTLPVLNP